jgi:hypothetical protein
MLSKLNYTVPLELIQEASEFPDHEEFRFSINQPTNDFFYDKWEIKPEYKDTVWDKLLQSLPFNDYGEARIISLKPATCYQSHSDIDDRYHLNISGDESFLVDLDDNTTHKLVRDGYWYELDAGKIHSAVNVGRRTRVQLVVRKLLCRGVFQNPINIVLTPNTDCKDLARWMFDRYVSKWLNHANKRDKLDNFKFDHGRVSFTIEQSELDSLKEIIPPEIKIE